MTLAQMQVLVASIDVAAYVLSDGQIIEALTDAADRGVVIRLRGLVEALLAHPNVLARVKGAGVLMHLKVYAVDGQVLRTGSGNFSRFGLADQDNDLILITDQAVVDAFEANFDRTWGARKMQAPSTRLRQERLAEGRRVIGNCPAPLEAQAACSARNVDQTSRRRERRQLR
jgi:phosphatidylserine/phosphatidylglycerophosphate/cardiolipin synthase-like enzyme